MMTRNWILPFSLLCIVLFTTQCALFRPVEEKPRDGNSRPGYNKEDLFRQDIVSYAKQFAGIEYKYAGTSPKTGFDCSGFTSYVMNNFNIELPHRSADQENQGKKIKVAEAQPGDLIFYRRGSLGKVFHVSLVVSNNREGITVIHSVSRGVVVENISTSSYWKPKISSARNVISR